MNSGDIGEILGFFVSNEAKLDLRDCSRYLEERSENAGIRFLLAANETFEFLRQNPGAGRQRERTSLQSLIIRQWPIRGFSNYLIFYSVLDGELEIQRVLHGAQNLSDILD